MKRVLVLMSTYNGEKFLGEQLDSLYNQTGVDLHILVRDDGSVDTTIEILKKYSETKGKLEILQGKNVGASKSFFEVVHYAQTQLPKFDYYAFCDQDDVWLPDKLISAVDLLEDKGFNKLYFCRANYVDINLNFIGTAPAIKFFDYTTCIYRNPALGCTMVFDRILLDIFCRAYSKIDTINCLHDAWMFECALFTGAKVVADSDIHILYRQHGRNVTLAKKSLFKRYKAAFERKFKRTETYKRNRQAFYDLYINCIEGKDKRNFLESLLAYDSSLRNTLRFLNIQKWKSESIFDKCLWNILVMTKRF